MDQVEAAECRAWAEYDSAADWCARHGSTGEVGSRLPDGLSVRAAELIADDTEAFAERVRGSAYARAESARLECNQLGGGPYPLCMCYVCADARSRKAVRR